MAANLNRILAFALTIGLSQVSIAADPTPAADEDALRTHHRIVWEQYLDASPAERTNLHVNPYVTELEKAYNLDATQSGLVRSKVESIAAERRQQMGPLAIEHDTLAEEASEIWWRYREANEQADDSPNRAGSFKDDPRYRQLRQRLIEIETQFPVDWDAAIDEVESVLPPQQASRGRVNIYKNRIDRAARRARLEAAAAKRMAHQVAGQVAAESTHADAKAVAAVAVKEVLDHAAREVEKGDLPPKTKARIKATIDQTRKNSDTKAPVKAPDSNSANPIARDLDRWEAYTRDFIEVHNLSENQQSAALSIMTELRTRAESQKKALAGRQTKVTRVADQARLDRQRAEINQRIENLFNQLTRRLEALLTVEQRRASTAKASPAKAKPASP